MARRLAWTLTGVVLETLMCLILTTGMVGFFAFMGYLINQWGHP